MGGGGRDGEREKKRMSERARERERGGSDQAREIERGGATGREKQRRERRE